MLSFYDPVGSKVQRHPLGSNPSPSDRKADAVVVCYQDMLRVLGVRVDPAFRFYHVGYVPMPVFCLKGATLQVLLRLKAVAPFCDVSESVCL